METDYLKLAAENQKRAREVIAESQIEQIWSTLSVRWQPGC